MTDWDGLLKKEEQTVFRLRELFEQYGYRKFKMSKFEEYDFYAENRSFLTTKNIITFQGLQGHLLALKPNVTLSIVKHTKGNYDCPERVYYNENVYRARKDDGEYKEIMQVGLEYIGEVDDYAVSEVVLLAKKSLDSISSRSVLIFLTWALYRDYWKKRHFRLPSRRKFWSASVKKMPMALHRFARKTVFLKNLQGVCRHWHPSMAVWQKSCQKQKPFAAMKKQNKPLENWNGSMQT